MSLLIKFRKASRLAKDNIMSESEMNSYRFNSGQDPTDEMLSQIMREVADDAKRTNEEASKKYFDELRNEANRQQAEWADRINEVRNGNF